MKKWILPGICLICALAFIPSFASILFLITGVLLAPIPFIKDLLEGWHIKGWLSGVLAAVIFLVGCFVAPLDNSKTDVSTSMERSIVATAEPTAEATPKATPTATPAATPTPTPEPTPTPTPMPEPTPAPVVEHTYVINTNTGKFHNPGCSSVKDIKPENRWDYTGTREYVVSQGFEPCGRCHP